MHILRETLNDFIVYFKPTTKAGVLRLGSAIVVLGIGGILLFAGGDNGDVDADEQTRAVTVASVAQLSGSGSLSLVGSVEAVDRATIQAEVGGRVTSVRVGLGDRVSNGQVIATIENSSQYASLLQAEGAYEAAVASAAQSDISVSSAQTDRVNARNSAVNTYRSAYNTANSAILNQIDRFFSNPEAQSTPGLRLDGYGQTSYLNNERVAFQSILSKWRTDANTLTVGSNLQTALTEAEGYTTRLIEMVDTFIVLLNDQRPPLSFSESELATYSSSFGSLRAELNATLRAIETARTSLVSAEETLDRARISGTGGTVSAADASVKQALGALRSAQANYNKTILRSPIAGVIQSLSVRSGDHIDAMTTVATVANQDALLITTFISNNERSRIAVGDTVTIEDDIVGTVTAIAPSVDPATGKVEVQIQSQSDAIQNGDTVRIAFTSDEPADIDTNAPITIPVAALKVESDRIVVFTVSEENTLIAHEITEGPLLGSSIVVADGITADMEIVTDARGLNAGEVVTVRSE